MGYSSSQSQQYCFRRSIISLIVIRIFDCPDVTGGAQFAFSVVGIGYYSQVSPGYGTTKVIFEDNKIYSGVDDCIRLTGPIQVSIKRNVILLEGGGDGDNINIKRGVTRDVAYNYIWSAANNSIKLETSNTLLTPITNVNIFNNTIIAGGWRKTGEKGINETERKQG
jgi:hypothetical protein